MRCWDFEPASAHHHVTVFDCLGACRYAFDMVSGATAVRYSPNFRIALGASGNIEQWPEAPPADELLHASAGSVVASEVSGSQRSEHASTDLPEVHGGQTECTARPRLFVVSSDNTGYEVLDSETFARYRRQQVKQVSKLWSSCYTGRRQRMTTG